jgi:hypothetical protein
MPLLRRLSCVLAVVLCLVANGSARAAGGAHVYLLRGIFDVSVGLDALAGKLGRIGIAASVYGHGDGGSVASEAIADYRSGRVRSIILIGHSLGAGAVVNVAHELDEAGVPVALLIALDPVASFSVPPNVRRAVDYYISGSGEPLAAEPGFRGQLNNLDVAGEPGMDHMAVQATDRMHARMLGYVRAAAGGAAAPRARKTRRPAHPAVPRQVWSLLGARPI